ncbi:MAG TPA: ATP-binding protein [Candidatus Faecisoma merdavium]|nr:ATP-binding protein [Candidatus Faecisoma merdavium]
MLKRENYLSRIRGFYDSDLIKILVGIRRCGKSVILNQIIDEIKEKNVSDDHIIWINFEYIEYEHLKDYKELNRYIKEKIIDKDKYYLFLDEIQKVDKFEEVINSIRASVKNVSIFITGSNSKLLSQELSTVLSGRYVLFNIYPLSYKEFIQLTNKNSNSEESFWNFVKWGGLPNRCEFNSEINIKDYLHSVFDSIILRDVVDRLGLKDTILFDLLLQYVVDTTGREFSAENVIKFLKQEGKSVSTETLYIYLDALCKALIIKKIYRYDIHGKTILKTLNKYYMTDLGIAQIKNNNFEINKGFALENVIYNELLIRGYDVYIGKTKDGEVDFIAAKEGKKEYYQVCYMLNSNTVINREFSAFDSIDDNYPKYVLSLDKEDFSKNGIIHKNIIDWLLEK